MPQFNLLTAEAMGLATSCPFGHAFPAVTDYMLSRTISLFNLKAKKSPGHNHEKNHLAQQVVNSLSTMT